MKKTLCKQMGLLILVVFLLNQVYATQTQLQNALLLPNLPPDSLVTKTMVNYEVPAAIIPLQSNMRNYVDKYLNENAETLENIKERKSGTFKTIEKILVKRGIPAELMYLAIVESELNSRATSRVGAAGIWQLMPETARSLGLQVNAKTDQRRHTNKSSVAAADYLKTLYKQFDDWLLVVAAYNCGAGNVYKAIKLSGSREFWKMQRYLPAETRGHVKHFIATHFYYEDNGSIVTLTKKERIRHLSSMNKMVVIKVDNHKTVEAPASLNEPSDCAVIDANDGALIVGLENK